MTEQYTDKEGKVHTEYHDKKGNLTESVIRYTDNDGNLRIEHYDGKEKLVRYTTERKRIQKRPERYSGVPTGIESIKMEISDGIEIREVQTDELQPKKGFKTVEHSLYWTDKNGVEHAVHERGKEKTHTTRYTDENGIEHSETHDWDGKLLGKTEKHFNKNNVTTLSYDGTGKLLKKSVDINTDDKQVSMDPNRGFWDKMMGHCLGKTRVDRWGKVTVYHASPERKKANTKLKNILKDSSLTGDEKKTRLRETVAKYREETGFKAPNAKVDAKLKGYLKPKKKER